MKRLLSVALGLCLLIALTLCAVATTTADQLRQGVADIDPDGSYADRLDHYNGLRQLEQQLDDSERAELSAELAECVGLVEKERVADEAEAEGVYFDDDTYPGVAEALADIAAVRQRVNACIAFTDAVTEASLIEIEEYAEVKEWLDLAKGYLDAIDSSYYGVPEAYTSYNTISFDLGERERHTKTVIDQILQVDMYPGYAMKQQCISEAKRGMQNELYEDECEFVAEGMAKLAEVEAYFADCIEKANAFILAVSLIQNAEDLPAALKNAAVAFKQIDTGVEGVGAAVAEYNNVLKNYNNTVKRVNAVNASL